MQASSQLASLRAAYDGAFRSWSAEVGRIRSMTPGSADESPAKMELRRKVAENRQAYHQARDLLAARLLERTVGAKDHDPPDADEARRADVARLAHELWEKGGRREGYAEADWYQAERLIRGRTALDS